MVVAIGGPGFCHSLFYTLLHSPGHFTCGSSDTDGAANPRGRINNPSTTTKEQDISKVKETDTQSKPSMHQQQQSAASLLQDSFADIQKKAMRWKNLLPKHYDMAQTKGMNQ